MHERCSAKVLSAVRPCSAHARVFVGTLPATSREWLRTRSWTMHWHSRGWVRMVFDEAVATEHFRQERDYIGVVGNLWLDLKSVAVKGVYVTKLEATHDGQQTCVTDGLLI